MKTVSTAKLSQEGCDIIVNAAIEKAKELKQVGSICVVDAGNGGDVQLAMVRRMIELIRGHYQGNFNWESHLLGRVVILSARPEDQPGLEAFMLREFFKER